MVLAGVEIFRLNFAHASNEQLIELKNNVKKIKEEFKKAGKDVLEISIIDSGSLEKVKKILNKLILDKKVV